MSNKYIYDTLQTMSLKNIYYYTVISIIIIIIIIPDLFYMDWPGLAKARAWRKPLHGWHCRLLINAFLVRNRVISPRMKTPRTLRRSLPTIEPATSRDLPLSVEFRVVPTLLSTVRPPRQSYVWRRIPYDNLRDNGTFPELILTSQH